MMWLTKVKFDWPLAKISPKMANGQLLFLPLSQLAVIKVIENTHSTPTSHGLSSQHQL